MLHVLAKSLTIIWKIIFTTFISHVVKIQTKNNQQKRNKTRSTYFETTDYKTIDFNLELCWILWQNEFYYTEH